MYRAQTLKDQNLEDRGALAALFVNEWTLLVAAIFILWRAVLSPGQKNRKIMLRTTKKGDRHRI